MYNWLNWWVPNERIFNYVLFMFFGLYLLPRLVGVQFTMLGYLVNLIWLDVLYYWTYKIAKEIRDKHDKK
jgi:uncharacterized membrane protein